MTANKEKASVEMKYVSDDADGSPRRDAVDHLPMVEV